VQQIKYEVFYWYIFIQRIIHPGLPWIIHADPRVNYPDLRFSHPELLLLLLLLLLQLLQSFVGFQES
jgi:hypothetical protein